MQVRPGAMVQRRTGSRAPVGVPVGISRRTATTTTVVRAWPGKGNKDEAAKEALRQAFEGKKDPWKLDEERAKKRGGDGGDGGGRGGSGGGGGGGGGGFGGFDPSDFGGKFLRWLRNVAKAVAAAGAFFGVILAFTFWEPLLRLIATIFRTVLRLDARNPAQVAASEVKPNLANKNELGDVEEAVIGQWGEDHQDVGSDDDEEDE